MLNQQYNFYQQIIFKLLVVASAILFAINLFLRMSIIPFHTVETGGIEINVIDGIIKILSGNYLYTDPANPPYDIMQYSPVYYYLVAGIAKLLHITPDDPQSVFMVSRSVALVSNLLTGLFLFFIARVFRLSKVKSILAAIFAFIILTQHYYSRGDSFYCLLFFISVFLLIKFIETGKSFFLIAFGISSFFCIFTKQSGIIIPLTAGLYFLLKRDFKSIGKLVLVFLIMTIEFIFISKNIGGLDAFYRNVVLGVKNGVSADMIKSFFNDKYYRELSVWVVIGFYLSFKIFRKIVDQRYFFILLLLFASLLFAFITGIKIGSSLNYFMECFMLTVIGAMIYISKNEPKYFRGVFYLVFILTLTIKTAELFSAIHISHYRRDEIENYEMEKSVSEFLLKEQVLGDSDYVYLNFRGYTELFLHGKSILNQKDFNYMVYVYASPEIDFTSMLERADHGLIKYLILKGQTENADIFGILLKNFQPIKLIGNYTIYKFQKVNP